MGRNRDEVYYGVFTFKKTENSCLHNSKSFTLFDIKLIQHLLYIRNNILIRLVFM